MRGIVFHRQIVIDVVREFGLADDNRLILGVNFSPVRVQVIIRDGCDIGWDGGLVILAKDFATQFIHLL